MAKQETQYQKDLVRRIKARFPTCFIVKNDEQYCQGIPDLTIMFGPFYAILEVKRSADEPFQPNQEHYLKLFAEMGAFSACIYPENEEEVLDALQRSFEAEW